MKIAITLLSCWSLAVSTPAFSQSAASPVTVPNASATPSLVSKNSESLAESGQTASVSQVRIVRLSQVAGHVEMDRKTDQHFEMAFVNLPVVAGAALRTRQGLAEVEFEDNSSLRLTPESQVAFPRLGREASGATTTTVDLLHGSLYVSLSSAKSVGDFTVNAGNQKIVLSPSSHLRLDLDTPTARMVVFQGSATITGPSGSLVVTKKKAISFDAASSAAPEFIQIADAGTYDNWDKNAVDYHKIRTVAAGFAGSPYSYGINDLSYYGSFSDIGGCGTMWRPHLASAAWDPYSSGVWSWYPGQGYTWVSLYPWGWAPFHSGVWDYCPAGGGWGWRPQNTWNGLLNHPILTTLRGPAHGPARPTPPVHPPLRGQPTMIAVNVTSLHPSQQGQDGKFVFRSDSAGLGVPRGVFNNLAKISQQVETHGTATASISEHQSTLGLIAPTRTSTNASASSFSASSANHSSATRSGLTTTGNSASTSFSSSHSVSTSAPSSGSFSSSSTGASASPAASSGSHH